MKDSGTLKTNSQTTARIFHPPCLPGRLFFTATVILAILLVSVAAPEPLYAADSTGRTYGPLSLKSQSPAQTLRMTMPFYAPVAQPAGTKKLSLGATWSNVWAEEERYLLDYEMVETRASASWWATDRWELGAAIENRAYMGGSMDSFIQSFHDLFGIDQTEKEKYPKDSTHLILRDAAGNVIRNTDETADFDHTNIYLSAAWLMTPGGLGAPAVGLTGMLRYGMGSPMEDGTALDAGIGIGVTQRWTEKWLSYHNLNFAVYGEDRLYELTFESTGFSLMNAVEWRFHPSLSVIFQYMLHQAAVEDFGALGDATHELDLGLRWATPGGSALEIALIENFINYDNGPDFAVHFGFSHLFK